MTCRSRVDNTPNLNAFKISVGGDYRGSTRADRFRVTAFSAEGKPAAHPTPLMRNFGGGLMPGGEIKPGEDWFEKGWVIEFSELWVRCFSSRGWAKVFTHLVPQPAPAPFAVAQPRCLKHPATASSSTPPKPLAQISEDQRSQPFAPFASFCFRGGSPMPIADDCLG